MNSTQEVYFSMTLKVKNFATKNAAIINPIPGVTAQITQLNTLITSLITTDTSSRSDLSGYAMSKQSRRVALEQNCLKFSNSIAALAANTGDIVLQKKADFPTSFWYSCTEDELITNANILKNLATPIIASLTPYLITAADLTAFGNALTVFTDSISDPTLAIDQRKVDNDKLPEIIDQIRTLFDTKLDVMMRVLEVSNPSIYQLYTLARALDDRGSSATPTIVASIAANTKTALHTASVYNASTFYTIQNMGTENVYFSLSINDSSEGPSPVLLAPGTTRVRLAETLAPVGTYLIVNNPSTLPVNIKLWVE